MTGDERASAIVAMEARSISAWPAHEELELDGWLLRFAGGYTRRSNSVNPLRSGSVPIRQKVEACERMYGQRGLPAVFKLTDAAEEGLDHLLEARGYAVAPGRTSVQCLSLASAHFDPADDGMQEFPHADERWVAAYSRMNGLKPAQADHLRRIVAAITPPALYLLATGPLATPVGCGLCVVRDAEAWLFDIAVDPAHRRRGHGRHIVGRLLAYAREQHARQACLQVVADNAPARRLYDRFGFTEHHEYWYRACASSTRLD